ncbi:MAG TPA: efflux RND transporter periplasmic adaptor subunit [Chitinophagaceae bacterium]|nr:efflux RND transporter periplasmic adaptor subunit [Chitinophagaceae bacterium]
MREAFHLIFIVTLLLSCSQKKTKETPTREDITEVVYASGVVKSMDQYQVFSPVSGLVKKIYVSKGDTVKKDQPILSILSETAKLNTENAQLVMENAAVNANLDKLNQQKAHIEFLKKKKSTDSLLLERQRNLWSQQIGARNDLDQRELAYRNDVETYNAAVFQYNDLLKQLRFAAAQSKKNFQISQSVANDFILKSQLDGRIYDIGKKEGEMVTTQSPLAIIGGAHSFLLELQVDEYDIAKIKPGQKVALTMDSYKGQLFEASIMRIIPIMNERTRTFTVEAVFTNSPPSLYPYLTVEANIIIQTKKQALTIPRDYLVDDSLVTLADGKKRTVVTGLKDYRKVEIISGLTANDIIVKPE